jgi:DNA polymerase
MNYAAVDFESYYDDECDVKTLGVDGYIRHPKFDAYLVSIVADNLEWVGHPKDAPWEKISGPDWEWIAHNASFDERIYDFLCSRDIVRTPATGRKPIGPRVWNCSSDLCRFSAVPGSLAPANFFLYKTSIEKKTMRDKMKGKIFATLSPEHQQEIKDYCLSDARASLKIWKDLSPNWPEHERIASRLSRRQAWRGIYLDQPALEQDAQFLKTLMWEAEKLLPWSGTEANLSYDALVAECHKNGIEAPANTSMVSEESSLWEDKYSDKYPWVDAMRTVRRANALLVKIETMLRRIRPRDQRMPYELRYFGTHTGRESSGGERTGRMKAGGFNDKNLPRKEMFGTDFFLGKKGEKAEGARFAHLWTPESRGINLRNRIIPAPGNKFILSDLKTIEPRVEWDMVGDYDSLSLVKTGMSVYQVHAIKTMGWTGGDLDELKETDPAALSVYQFSKARVLALGYQAGWIKFITMAKMYDADAAFDVPTTPDDSRAFESYLKHCRIPEWRAMWEKADPQLRQTYVNSWKVVTEFRRTNPLIVNWWKELHTLVRKAVGDQLEIELPSGRILLYRDVRMDGGQMSGTVIKFGRPMRMKLYGGILAENICQAIARDVFIEGLIRVNQAGYKVVMDVYDELVAEVSSSDMEAASKIQALMAVTPEWRPTLPVGASVRESMCYLK